MTRSAVIALVLLLCPLSLAAAQPPARDPQNPVSDTVRQFLARDAKNLIGAAELMPAEKYAYHPTPAQMTFGQLVVHVVQTNEFLCSAIAGSPKAPPMDLKETAPKETLVQAIRNSFDHCTAALAKVTDAQLNDAIPTSPAASMSRASMMIAIAVDWADHYSTAAGYLRLNGILPPSAQPNK